MGAETINRTLYTYFNSFGIPAFLEDSIPVGQELPYITYSPVIPDGWGDLSAFHARVWYPSKDGRAPVLQMVDKIADSLQGSLCLTCDGGAILLRRGDMWAQPMDNTPEGYLCEYLQFTLERFIE